VAAQPATTGSSARSEVLPLAARRLVYGIIAVAFVLAAVTIVLSPAWPTPFGIGVIALGVLAAEALTVQFSFRRGGKVAFGLSEAVLTAGLVLFPAPDVVLGAALGVLAWQGHVRVETVKLVANVGQYVSATAAAAIPLLAITGGTHGLDRTTLTGLVVAVVLFILVNTGTVSAFIASTSGQSWLDVYRRLAPTAALMASASAFMGLLALVLLEAHALAVPVLAVPVAVLYWGGRLDVKAREDRERSAAFVTVEQRLRDAGDATEVCRRLVEGTQELLGCEAAVWRHSRWVTPVPKGSRSCPVDADLPVALLAKGPALGPAVEGMCAAIGLGDGVLVVWPGELGISASSEEWIEHLGRSGRVHLDRAAAHAALEQERATLRAVVDGTADGILVLDGRGVVRLWNPGMGQLSGITAGAALGRPVTEILGAGPWSTPGFHDLVRQGERVWRVSLAAVREDTFGTGSGGGELRVGVVHDVTAERRAARMKDDMLAVVSHELRTPLTPIKASAQLLRRRWDRLPEPQRTELLGQIESRADHLARLVEDLLLVGQLSGSRDARPPIRPVPVDLTCLVADCVEQLAAAHPMQDLQVESPAALRVFTDPVRIRQILDNLVGNACKFSPPGSPVVVQLAASGDEVTLTVRDHGRGIPAGDLQRVFERFERVEDPLVMTTSGAGLGLYIVRALARAMGGDVTLESFLALGTTVMVRIIAERAPAETPTGSALDRVG
jgi:PAS domain S-box-containing protein